MAIPVLLILAVLWAAVLVPPVLRSRSESRRGSVGDFTSRLDALRPRFSQTAPAGRPRRGPLQAVPTQRATAARASSEAAQKRRRDVLIVLAGAAVVTLLLAAVVRVPLLWMLQGLADVLVVAYLALLLQLKYRSSLLASPTGVGAGPAVPPSSPPLSLAHPRIPRRPELAPFPESAPSLRRTASG